MAADPLISIYAMKLQAMRQQRMAEEERSIREKEIERATINDAFDRTIKGYQANLQAEAALDKMQFGVHKQMADQRMAEMETLRKERELKLKEAEVRQQSLADLESRKEFQTTERVATQLGRTAEAQRQEKVKMSKKWIDAQVEVQKARALAAQPAKDSKIQREADAIQAKNLKDAYTDTTKKKAKQMTQFNNEIRELDKKITKGTGKFDMPFTRELAGWKRERQILIQQRKALTGLNIIKNGRSIRQAEAEMIIIQGQKREEQGRVWTEYGTEGASTPSGELSEEEIRWQEYEREQASTPQTVD